MNCGTVLCTVHGGNTVECVISVLMLSPKAETLRRDHRMNYELRRYSRQVTIQEWSWAIQLACIKITTINVGRRYMAATSSERELKSAFSMKKTYRSPLRPLVEIFREQRFLRMQQSRSCVRSLPKFSAHCSKRWEFSTI